MTNVFAISSLKGGTGKTTTAILLGCALVKKQKTVLVVDTDPQGSATVWADLAADEGNPLPFDVTIGNMRTLERLHKNVDYILIDTPPGNGQIIDAAIRVADQVIIPVRPSAIEVDRMWDAIDMAVETTPTTVLLTSVIHNTKSHELICQALKDEGINVFNTGIPQREAIKSYFGHRPQEELYGYESIADQIVGGENK